MPTASAMAAKLGFWSSVPSQWTSAPLDEAQCTVVEHRNFHGETVLGQGKKISHQHGEAAVARERNHLPTGKGRVRAYCLRHRTLSRARMTLSAAVCHSSRDNGQPTRSAATSQVKIASSAASLPMVLATYWGWISRFPGVPVARCSSSWRAFA